jgi:hypothetical protein
MKKKSSKKKKKTRRSEVKYPALDSSYMPKVRQEYFDLDYLDQLNDEEKEWMNKFMNEELNASFKNDDTDLAQTKEEKRKAYSKNNARNRCLYGVTKANGLMENADLTTVYKDQDVDNTKRLVEDAMIAEIDKKYGENED